MTNKVKAFIIGQLVAVTSFAIVATVNRSNMSFTNIKAANTEYSLTLNSSNAPAGLTANYQRTVTSTVTTGLDNEITFVHTIAKSLENGYVQLGNYGTVYCITNNNKHISGLIGITVNYSGGSLRLRSSSVDTVSEGSSYLTDAVNVPNGIYTQLANAANSFVLEAGAASVSITSINLKYSCATNSTAYDFSKVYDVDDFEAYSADGVGYDGSHNMGVTTNLRAAFYSTYYGAGTNPLSGTGWTIMGSTDYLTYNANKGVDNSKCALFKSNASNYFHYLQSKHFFGVPVAIGKGNKLSAFIKGAFSNTSATTNSANSATVTLIAYYNKILNKEGLNDAATATYTIPANADWAEYTVTLDPTKTIYAFGIHIAKAAGTIYVPVDNVKIYTTSPYGEVAVTGVSLNTNNINLTINETKTLVASVLPANATDNSVTWTSSNSSIASVDDNGVVTANAVGNATITVTTVDGGFTATCEVTVTQTYPGGTYFTTVTLSSRKVNIEVVLTTRSEVKVWFYGLPTEGARFTSYNQSTGAFIIQIDGNAELGALGTYTYGDMTGYYRNDRLESVGLTGDIKNLLGNINNSITIPHPTNAYWNCDGTTTELQNTFRRRWRNGSSWAFDDSNSNRIEADTINKTSGTSGVKVKPYASGVGIVFKDTLNNGSGFDKNTYPTFSCWIYNPSSSSVAFRLFLYKNADLSSNFEPQGTFSIGAQSWKYLRIGYKDNQSAGTVYNFMITNLGANSSETFVLDDIWFHN